MRTERYIALASQPGTAMQVLRPAVEWFLTSAAVTVSSEAAVVVAQRRDLESVAPAFGLDGRELASSRQTTCGVVSYIETALPSHVQLEVPVLAAWCGDTLLEKVEELNPPLLCVVDWEDGWVERWVSNYGSTDILSGEVVGGAPAIGDPDVLRVVQRIDRGARLAGVLDKRDAVNALKVLHEGGNLPPGDVLSAWAVNENGMTATDGKTLADFADRVRAGCPPRTR